MSFAEWFAPGPRSLWLALAASAQVAVVVLAAGAISRAMLRRRPAARHRVWLCALACVLLGPAAVVVAEGLGLTLPIVPRPRAAVAGGRPEIQARPDTRPPAAAIVEPAQGLHGTTTEPDAPAPGDVPPPPTSAAPSIAAEATPAPSAAPPLMASETARHDEKTRPRAEARVTPPSVPRATGDAARGERRLVGALALAWLAGVAIGLGRLALGWRRLARLRRAFRPFDAEGYGDVLAEVREALGVGELPPILTSPDLPGPVAVGVLRPAVVLPEGLAAALGPGELRDVLVHECAHVLRRDAWVGLLQRVAAALYWPHPLVHALNAQLARAREEVCDNFVLRCGDPCGYARTLLALTERCRRPSPAGAAFGLSGTRWTLTDRIAGLLDPRRDAMTTPNRWAAGPIGLTLIAATVCLAGVRPAGQDEPSPRKPEPPAQAPRVAADKPSAWPERTARGVVVDEAGRPVAGATVFAAFRHKTPEPAVTDAEGRFSLTLVGYMLTGEYLIASSEDGARLGLGEHVEPQHPGPPDPVRIVLKPSRTVTVHVRDEAGKPVAGASVEALGYDFHGLPATTGEGGDATLRVPADAQVRCIIGLKSGVGFDYFENYREIHAPQVGPPPAEVTLVLDGARTVRIRAVDSSGEPVPDIESHAWTVGKPNRIDDANIGGAEIVRARTDERGIATLAWLPTKVHLGASFLSYPGAYSCPDPLYIQPGVGTDAVELKARMLRNTRISGVVREADGRPAAGILVRAEGRGPTSHYCRMHARTGEDGSYRFDVAPEQSYMIAVLDDRRAARSLTGVVVREGRSVGGLDLTLGEGTVLRGRVTKGADEAPAAGETITLIQQGEKLPEGLVSDRGEGKVESLPRWAKSDRDGRYQIRVGPGRYQIFAPGVRPKEDLRVADEREIVRDFEIAATAQGQALSGLAIEETPAGDRPIPGAIVEATTLGRRRRREVRALADDEGRFRLTIESGEDLMFYVRDREGKVAGLTTVAAGADDVRVFATRASRVRGRVVDRRGRPRPGLRVDLRFGGEPSDAGSGRFAIRTVTDAEGRYEFGGVVVDSIVDISTILPDPISPTSIRHLEPIEVLGPDSVEAPDLVVREDGDTPARAEAPAPAPAAAPRRDDVDPAAIASRSVAPTRAELEELVRAIGRDPVTPELVDRAWLLTRPQFVWSVDLDRLKSLVADPEFTGRIDQASQRASGRPADAPTLIGQTIRYHVGYDVPTLTHFLRQRAEAAAKPEQTAEGRVVDGKTRRPIAGAVVFTADALARTDEAGGFRLKTSSARPRGILWVEAEGYATAEYPAFADEGDAAGVVVELVEEAVVTGRVVAPGGEPIPGAVVRAWLKHFDLRVPRPDSPPADDSYGFPVEVVTDASGRFALRGLPPGLSLKWCEIRHPEYRTLHIDLKAGEPATHRMEPGCKVAGVVVDDRGRPIPKARVEIRSPGRLGDAFTTHTGEDGRFRFGGVDPGLWTVIVQPERHAPLYGPVVASPDRPVENQYIASPGAYIGGRVVGPDDEPVAGVAVGWAQPEDERGRPSEALELGRMTVTAEDGTFRLGPLPQGEIQLTGVIEGPRRLGRTTARANQANAVIRLAPDPLN